MPCIYITTNVNVDEFDKESFYAHITTALSTIIRKHPRFVMIILNGSVPIQFNGNKEPAAFVHVASMGGITTKVKRDLITTVGNILEEKLSIPRERFVLTLHDASTAIPNHHSKL